MSDNDNQQQEDPLHGAEEETPPTRQNQPAAFDPADNLADLSHQDQLAALEGVRIQLQAVLDRASAVGDNPGLAAEVEGARNALAGVVAHIASGATTATTAGAVPPAANSPPVPSLSLFSRTTDLPDHEIGLEAITLPKNKRGIEGTKQGSIDRERAITPLEGKFDLMSHQTKYSTGGAATDRSMDQSIKVQIVNLLQLIRRGSDHAINYDLHEITEIGVLVSPSTTPTSPTSCSTWWSLTESSGNLWDAWEAMDENTVLCHQFSLNKRGGKEEQRSNRWLGTFLKASCSAAMCDKLETKISKLPVKVLPSISTTCSMRCLI